ncbi:zinc-ribbon-domain-containing protein [Fimicolochytrium jonesii]|uniref:zinc-ribbon-domain-containing protein n=1 Tax=Fimicolochytrium jonesii TaxID=1396493 RepID=UPI0022FE5F5E|nr:zinc-ribbon-domain-containing protein [Fimicolochytrium jonesii]KAI8817978.1 zinc-ribbon-domain-containing protein [Fimicolochytrium jonesii]
MTQGWSATQQSRATTNTRVTNRLENRRRDYSHVTEIDREPTFHDRNQGVLGCKHYQRAAKLQAHCCGKWDTCRFCHDEVSDHNIVRNLITTMLCMYCGTVQPAGQDCINEGCRRRVAKYYCKECKLWDSDPRKNIYHCYDCGICRIGKGLGIDYFHCKKCNVCMAISLKGRHKCIERNLESDCPICGEYMFTSTTTVIFMPCGHCIHYKCHQEYIQTSYQCPTCLKSLADMTDYFRRIDQALAQQQMPQEYSNLYNQIYCNDCEKKCFAKFHFMYHKCVNCRGYNTKVLNTADQNLIPPEELKQINALASMLVNSANPAAAGDTADASSVQEPSTSRRASAAGRGASRRASMVQRGVQFWCHQCQASTNPVMVAGSQRCGTCDSDFLEQL